MSLLNHPPIYKPFKYPWAYDAWLMQQRNHWLPEEIPMGEDVVDYKTGITEAERNVLTQIFRFFTQSDIEVNGVYQKHYMRVFKPTEVLMMLGAFANIETVHIAAYAHLIDTLGLPETEYSAFLQYKEMKDKFDAWQNFNVDTPYDIAKTLACFGAFTEGLQLFASFAILMNLPRIGKMKGMGQIVSWSIRDESGHCANIIKLYHTFLSEHPDMDMKKLKDDLYSNLEQIVKNEDAFIDLAFQLGDMRGLTSQEVKQYVRYIANRRLQQLGLHPIYQVPVNPLPWMDAYLHADDHTNFFDQRSTEYSKAATKGDWADVFNEGVNP